MQFLNTVALLVAATGAIMINQPAMNAVWTVGQDETVSWSSVNTDPTSISIYLVNFSRYPTQSILLQSGVAVSAGSISASGANSTSGSGYQVNFIFTTNSSQILAQSNQFSINSSSGSSATSMVATTAQATAAATSAACATASTASGVTSSLPVSGNYTLPVASTSSGSVIGLAGSILAFALGSVLALQ